MKIQASDIVQSFKDGVSAGFSPFGITVNTNINNKIGVLFDTYSLMGYTIIGDWESLNECKDFVKKYVASKSMLIAEKWNQIYGENGESVISPNRVKVTERDDDDTSFSTGEIAPIDADDNEIINTPNIKSRIHSTTDDTDTETINGIDYFREFLDTADNIEYLTLCFTDIAYQLFDQTTRFY